MKLLHLKLAMFTRTTNKPDNRPAPKLGAGYVARNFTRAELACRCCGEYVDAPRFLEALQRLRDLIGVPLKINSGHRCALHNALIGGAAGSAHLHMAVDIDLRGIDRVKLSRLALEAGFTGFGFYTNFLHLDLGRARKWYGSAQARRAWNITGEV